MSSTPHSPAARGSRGNGIPRVIVATTALLTFISFWRAAAIVLNDLASSAYYAAAKRKGYIGKTAPWFILAIMLFSYAVRAVLRGKLQHVRARRRVSRRENVPRRDACEIQRFRADV